MVKLIVKEVPAVQLIVYLGIHAEPLTYYLLVLTSDEDKTTGHELTNKIEDKCRPLASVLAFVHKTRIAVRGLTNGSRFWNLAMAKGITTYKVPGLELPLPSNLSEEVLQTRRTDNWQRWGRQGQEFLKGARFYVNNNNEHLALFMLHQAAESTLIGIIKVLCGYKPSVHNLSRMLKITQLFTDGLQQALKLNTAQGEQAFILLQSAYTAARYKENFDPNAADVKTIADNAENLLAAAEAIYRQLVGEQDTENPK